MLHESRDDAVVVDVVVVVVLVVVVVVVAESLNGGQFHSHLREIFAPQVVRYIDLMESSIAQSIHTGFEKETWKAQG